MGRFAWHVAMPLVAGISIYAFGREGWLWMETRPAEGPLSEFVKYNLADGLWVYSLTALMILVWRGESGRERVLWIFGGVVVAVVSELCQAFGGIPGTFDPIDMLCYVVAFATAHMNLYFSK